MQPPRDREIAANAAFAKRLFGTDEPAVDIDDAYEAVLSRVHPQRPGWLPAAMSGAIAAAFAAALLLTPLGGYAMALLTIFEPKQFVPIALSADDAATMRGVPRLEFFGTLAWNSNARLRPTASLSAASASAGLTPRQFGDVRALPSGPVRYFVLPPRTLAFTFSAAKARAYERRFGRHLPPMPAGLDGATIRVTAAAGIVTTYGSATDAIGTASPSEPYDGVAIVQFPMPRVTSTGATIETLERYLLAMPNVPADVAAQLRAIADPATALPVPFQIDKTSATPVEVDGSPGLAIGDQTGLGSAVLWQKHGIVYAIGGSLKASEALALANDLK